MSGALRTAVAVLSDGRNLSSEHMANAMEEIASGTAHDTHIAAFLIALRVKGETSQEIAAAARVVRHHCVEVDAKQLAVVDTCGTGGDDSQTFNISTTAAIVAAAAGAVVAKHGNRSVSSRCGSADLLEALGVTLTNNVEQTSRCLQRVHLAFLFAPVHHPAFAVAAPVRRDLGVRTIFNLIGPLANPAGARCQLLGVSSSRLVPIVANALASLGTEHALVVHGDGSDEIAITGVTRVCEVRGADVRELLLTPESLNLPRRQRDELLGGDAATNARICRAVINGEKSAPRDAVLANAGATLYVAGVAPSIVEGIAAATAAIDNGSAQQTLASFIEESQKP